MVVFCTRYVDVNKITLRCALDLICTSCIIAMLFNIYSNDRLCTKNQKNHYTSILGTLFNLFVLRLGSGFERVVACNRTQIKANWQDILGQENISKKLSDAKTLPWALSIATQEHPRQGNI